MLVEYEGRYYESLSLAMARVLLGNPPIVAGFAEPEDQRTGATAVLEWLDLVTARGNVRIPVVENVMAWIPYRGAQRSFPSSRRPMR